MAKKKTAQKKKLNKSKTIAKKKHKKEKQEKAPLLSGRLRVWILALCIVVFALFLLLAFFNKAGTGGLAILRALEAFMGKTVFLLPALFAFACFLLFKQKKKRTPTAVILAMVLFVLSVSGILNLWSTVNKTGGWLGFLVSWPLISGFNLSATVSLIIFCALLLISFFLMYEFFPKEEEPKQEKPVILEKEKQKPKFEIKPIVEMPFKQKQKEEKPPAEPIKKESTKEPAKVVLPVETYGYKRPPLSLFNTKEEAAAGGDTEYNAMIIKKTLQNFNIDVEMADVNIGPTVTQYTLKPSEGVKLAKITTLNNDLALALAAHPIRIEAPIPGKALVGVEVPNAKRANVTLGSLLANPAFESVNNNLAIALGRDVMGEPMLLDIARMPHMLVAGATGTGKTICLNSLILSLIYRNSPKVMRLILIDPKRVEFSVFADLPHLLTPVILSPKKAVNALNWLVSEMERRFEVLREAGSRDIVAYNQNILKKQAKQPDLEIMPYIVLMIDELADLMMAKGKEVEAAIVRLSQLARAVGVHLVVATQRPSVEVITGLIKANITSRISFQVASQIDARTILDTSGSEKLLGRGDLLYVSADFSRPKRIQGSFVTSNEMKKVVEYIVKENSQEDMQEMQEETNAPQSSAFSQAQSITSFSVKDDLYDEAKEIVIEYQKASASLLQRRLQVGYARAARILDELEENGVVGPQDGSKAREVYAKSLSDDEPDKEGFVDPNKVEFE